MACQCCRRCAGTRGARDNGGVVWHRKLIFSYPRFLQLNRPILTLHRCFSVLIRSMDMSRVRQSNKGQRKQSLLNAKEKKAAKRAKKHANDTVPFLPR